ncbi:thiocillin family RiPP [Nonomuraea sediminis]|uniref:thiocillin family RiPP n=1 Tax=Nonomuraea sediminis TaxID=2835864 RepID=UPI001BDBDDC0|nr:thiocillin family RiPP [Nonomuraea sediminis]
MEQIELYAFDDALDVEELPAGNALGCFFSSASASTASCPLSSASCVGTASTFS